MSEQPCRLGWDYDETDYNYYLGDDDAGASVSNFRDKWIYVMMTCGEMHPNDEVFASRNEAMIAAEKALIAQLLLEGVGK